MALLACIYCRISQDATREGLGVQRQEEDCRRLAEREGLPVGAVFIDNDKSGSKKTAKRPGYEEMVRRVRAGEFTHILAYSNTRLTRQMRQLEDLIDLHEETGVQFFTVVSGNDDLSTATGRQTARIKGSIAAGEAELTGERVKRRIRQRVESGQPRHNRYVTFGYNKDWTVNEGQAALIRDAFTRIAAGESIQSVVDLWKKTGVVVGGGKTLYNSTVRNIIANPLYAGLMRHHGEIVGKANVEPLVSEDLLNAAQAAIEGRTTAKTGRYARKYLLASLVICGLCGFSMPGKSRPNDKYNYECAKASGGCGKQGISGQHLEALVLSVIRQSLIVGYTAPVLPDLQPQIDAVKEDVEAIQQGIRDRTLRAVEMSTTLADLTRQLRKLEEQNEAYALQRAGTQFDDWDSFVEGTIYEQVATVRRHIRGVEVRPATSKAWNPDRVTVFTARGAEIRGGAIKVEARSLVVASNKQGSDTLSINS